MNTKTHAAAGFWLEEIEPEPAQLVELENWFGGHGLSVEMANGVGSRIGSYKLLRKKLLKRPNDSYYSLYGEVNVKRSNYLEDCWDTFAGITRTDAILVRAREGPSRNLFEDLLGMSFSSRFVVAYERKCDRFDDAQMSDMGLCSSRMNSALSAETVAWGDHLRSGKVGTKLRNVYRWNAFRPGHISASDQLLEDWITKTKCGRLLLDAGTGLICWECDDDEVLRAQRLLNGSGALVSTSPVLGSADPENEEGSGQAM